MTTDDLAGLAAVPLFAGLDRAWLHRLAAGCPVRTVPAGSTVARYGTPAGHLIVVETGTLTAVRETRAGRRLRLGEFAGPCAVDKSAVLGTGGHTATWLAATRARLRRVPAGVLHDLVGDVPAARQHVLSVLARQVQDRTDELVRGRVDDTVTRTAAWLVSAAGRSGPRVILPGAQPGLAETIGASRVSVNRALRSLARDGLVRTEPGAVVILAPELLARRASAGQADRG